MPAKPPVAHGLSREAFAARIVGRTLDGDVLMPGGATRSLALGNEFGFTSDTDGQGCPLGAHIRRGNPRDMLGNNPDGSWDIVNRHRVLRRGRAFGRQGWTSYCDTQPSHNRFNEPGLMFVVLNADIERQFEFVQQNWINDPGFAELGHERDPLVGVRATDGGSNVFTISATPVRQRVSGLANFVTVQGGEYFFLPGIQSLGRLVGARP